MPFAKEALRPAQTRLARLFPSRQGRRVEPRGRTRKPVLALVRALRVARLVAPRRGVLGSVCARLGGVGRIR